jgi:hypothetical protein
VDENPATLSPSADNHISAPLLRHGPSGAIFAMVALSLEMGQVLHYKELTAKAPPTEEQ